MTCSQVLVVVQDSMHLSFRNPNIRVLNLNMPYFSKAKMVNRSVEAADRRLLIMLDGDRILPSNYFTNQLRSHHPGQIITTRRLYKLARLYDIASIERGDVIKHEDFRDPANTPGKKNLFSGNVIMTKDDFLRAGGMDEAYTNYGCADLDFSMQVEKVGLTPVYTEDEELHLWHKVDMTQRAFELVNCKSVLQFCRKWGQPLPLFFENMIKNIPREQIFLN